MVGSIWSKMRDFLLAGAFWPCKSLWCLENAELWWQIQPASGTSSHRKVSKFSYSPFLCQCVCFPWLFLRRDRKEEGAAREHPLVKGFDYFADLYLFIHVLVNCISNSARMDLIENDVFPFVEKCCPDIPLRTNCRGTETSLNSFYDRYGKSSQRAFS